MVLNPGSMVRSVKMAGQNLPDIDLVSALLVNPPYIGCIQVDKLASYLSRYSGEAVHLRNDRNWV